MQTNTIKRTRGFSLPELLVVIAIIGIIAMIATSSLYTTTVTAKRVKSQKNAQTICVLYANAVSTGASFSATSEEGILEELITGVTGGHLDVKFAMPPMLDEQKAAALAYCSYDASEKTMNYEPGS